MCAPNQEKKLMGKVCNIILPMLVTQNLLLQKALFKTLPRLHLVGALGLTKHRGCIWIFSEQPNASLKLKMFSQQQLIYQKNL